MQPLSIAGASLVSGRVESLTRSQTRESSTAVQESGSTGIDEIDILGPKDNTGGPTDSVEDHDIVQLEPWYPTAIYHDGFVAGPSYFNYIGFGNEVGNEGSWVPSLMLNWDMFRSLWKLASATRELQSKQEKRDEESYRCLSLSQALYRSSEKEQKAIDDLQHLCDSRPDLWPELYPIGAIHEQNIAANNANADRLHAEKGRAIESYNRALTKAREAQDAFRPHLDDLFGSLGVLPDVNDLAAPIEVPVIEPNLAPDDAQFFEWPENTWNDDCNHPGWGSEGLESMGYHDPDAAWNDAWQEYSTEEPIQRLSLEVEDKRQEALNAKADFDNFRGTYDEEFYKYMGRTSDAQAVAEKNFGPVWVQMSQAVTKRARDTEEAFYSAEERLSEAKRAAKLQIRAGASRDEISCVKVWDEAEVDNFGQMVPSRKRKHIDDWLEQETSCTKKTKTQAIESKPLSRKRKHSDDSLEEEVSPKKIKTQAIEGEPSSRKRKHSDDSLEEVSPKKIKTQAIKDKTSSYKRKHSDDILELTSSSKKIKTQAAVDDDVIFDLSEHSADVSVVEIADGYQRRKIDNYIRQAQAARPILPGRRFSDMSLFSLRRS